ncbi:MAG TPA: metal-sensitive transcriptional regulator [Acidimicrobiales bacterium]|nr:metal-sensitive transcriptional regulator [Acidimicrobiales bacterium]
MRNDDRTSVLKRLRIARGHLDGVIRMVEADAYCPDVMKQLSAVQGSVQQANRLVLRNHLETCVADAMRAGRTEQVVDELMEALRFDPGPVAAAAPAAVGTTPTEVPA